MGVDFAFWECLLAGGSGFLLSLPLEILVEPKTPAMRPWQSWFMQFGLWGLLFSFFVCLSGRPWCSACFCFAFWIILVLVNRAKFRSMREPLLFQDYDYFLDTIRFPRLFLPFLGLRAFCMCALGVLLALLALWLEPVPPSRWRLDGQAGATLLFFTSALAAFILACKFSPVPNFSPVRDLRRLGYIPSLAFYGIKWSKKEFPNTGLPAWAGINCDKYPFLVAVQSESFFDARQCWPAITKEIYAEFDLFVREAFLHGDLLVPAWGANTERSEFSFLSGISPAKLGFARFNPYQLLAAGWHIPALPAHLRSLGYRTICVHPYMGAFYKRDVIFPDLGFDEFIDISQFNNEMRHGPYIGDEAVADKILEIQEGATKPVFIFAITMENHGPLHLESAPEKEAANTLFTSLPPENCDELGIYLRHVRNTGRMLKKLHDEWQKHAWPVSLCFYGDHVPIMPQVWQTLNPPKGVVPYFCWDSRIAPDTMPVLLASSQLAAAWLGELSRAGRINRKCHP